MPQASRVSSEAHSRSERCTVCSKKESAPGARSEKKKKQTKLSSERYIPIRSGEMLIADLLIRT